MNARVLCALSILSLPAPALASGRFYLSTDKVFAPGQEIGVAVEAQGVESLQLRLYRLESPAAWFDAQADLHRPSVEHRAARARTWSLLSRGARAGVSSVADQLRASLGRSGRAALREAFPEWHDTARAGASAVTPETVLPPLREHPLVDAWEQPIAAAEGWAYDTIPLQLNEVGVYLLEASSGESVATTLVIVTDVALVTKQSAEDLVVWAVDPATGQSRSGVKLTVKRDGAPIGEATTGADGIARFQPGLSERLVIYGQAGASFTLVDPRFFASNLPEPKVYVFTERPVYRPAQEVFWKAFARRVEKSGRYAPMAAGKVPVELIDPEGTVWSTAEVELSDRGGCDGSFTLPEEPPLGTWQIVVTIDGQKHAGQLKVMAFVKPEVRLTVRADAKAVTAGQRLSGDVVGQYFFGAPYPGAEVKITLSRTRFHVPWWVDADYRWYYSDAEYRSTAREVLEESKCTLDAKGECPFAFDTKVEGVDHTYIVEAAALDPAGRTVTGSADVTVTTGQFRLAIEPGPLVVAPGSPRPVVVRAIDYAGAPVRTQVALVVSAQRVKGDQVETVEVMRTTAATDDSGRARFTVDPAQGGYYTLRASAKDPGGHAIEEESFVFASSGAGDLPFAPSDVEIVTDKQSYFAGEKALVLVLAPAPEAKVLFTVEGARLDRAEVLTARRHAVLTEVTIGPAQTPNFFLGATAVTGGQVFTKQRSVIVPPREAILKVEVAPERAVAQPGETLGFTVVVTDHAGKPVGDAEVALGIVDEAIYAISPEIAVPLESFYYPRKRNDVRTHESISFRAFGTSRGPEVARRWDGSGEPSYGSLKPQLDDVRKVFRDTAGWSPAGVTDANGKVWVQVTLPDNLTAWRATARVMTRDARVGSGTGSIKARKPVMVTVAVPPRMVEGDRGQGALVVQNHSGKRLDLALSWLAAPVAGTIDPTPPGLSLSALPKTVAIDDGQTQRLPFTYTASGSGSLSVRAKLSGGGFEDGVESVIPIEAWATMRRASARGRTSPLARSAAHVLALPDGAAPGEARLEIELVSSAMAAIQGALPYLAEFPYGCTEQTMSRFVPLLAAKGAIDQLQLDAGALARTLPPMIDAGLARLAQLQHEDGGWGWWESDASDPWMTAYALDGLAEAKRWGVTPDAELVTRGLAALDRLLAEGDRDAATRAFAAHVLARHDRAPAGMIQAVADEARPTTLAHLAMAAKRAGKTEVAQAAISRLVAAKTTEGGLVKWGDASPIDPSDHEVEATALALLAMIEAGGPDAEIRGASAWLLAQFEDQRFGSTRQTALAVRALAAQLARAPLAASTVTVLVDGKVVATETFDRARAAKPAVKLSPNVALASRNASIEVRHEGEGEVSHAVALVAPVRARVLGGVSQGGLTVKRSFHEISGAVGSFALGKSGARYAPGDTVLVKLEVTATKPVPYLMVEDPRPAGLAAVSSDAGLMIEGVELRPAGVRRELRDDRTAFFMASLPKGKTNLYYLARAGLAGRYHALPARAESMYLPNTHHGQSSSAELEVRAADR